MSTGTTIRDLRKQHRLSQTELAKAVHVSQATVTAWETGKAEPSSSALNTVFVTKHKERIPIMFYKINNQPFEVDIHVQLIDVEISKTHTIHVKVTNKYTNEIIFEGDQSFNMEKEGKKPEGKE